MAIGVFLFYQYLLGKFAPPRFHRALVLPPLRSGVLALLYRFGSIDFSLFRAKN